MLQCFQAFHGRLGYLNIENMLELSVFISSLLLVLDIESCQSQTGYRMVSFFRGVFSVVSTTLCWSYTIQEINFIFKRIDLRDYIATYILCYILFLNTFLAFSLSCAGNELRSISILNLIRLSFEKKWKKKCWTNLMRNRTSLFIVNSVRILFSYMFMLWGFYGRMWL